MCRKAFKTIFITVFCLSMALITGAVAAAAEPTVLFSMDFENTTPGELPTGWVGNGKVVQDKAFAGKASLFVEDTTPDDYMQVQSPLIAVKPGAIYTLSVMGCVSDLSSEGNFAIFVREADADAKDIKWHLLFLEKGTVWLPFSEMFQLTDKAAFIEIFIYPAATGKMYTNGVWIDDLKIVQSF